DHDDVLAGRGDLVGDAIAGIDLVLLRQEVHGEVHAAEIAPGHRQIARGFGAPREHHRIELGEQLRRGIVPAHFHVRPKLHALDRHLRHAPVDQVLLHLEIGNAVTQEPADAIGLLEHHDIVTRTRELLCAGESRRARAHHRDALAGLLFRRLRRDPAFLPCLVGDVVLDRLDADRVVVDVERARGFAGGRADAARDLGEVVGGMQHVDRGAHGAAIHEIVPVRNDVVDRAAALAERDAAIHAARALLRRIGVGQAQDELAVMTNALGHRLRRLVHALELHETRDLPHDASLRRPQAACFCFAGFDTGTTCSSYISVSARVYSCGSTLTNFGSAASQSSRMARASVLPVKRRWRSINSRSNASSVRPAWRRRPLPAISSSCSIFAWSISFATRSRPTMVTLQRLRNSSSGSYTKATPPLMPAAKLRPVRPSTTTVPPVMYSHPWSPVPSTTALAPELRTQK